MMEGGVLAFFIFRVQMQQHAICSCLCVPAPPRSTVPPPGTSESEITCSAREGVGGWKSEVPFAETHRKGMLSRPAFKVRWASCGQVWGALLALLCSSFDAPMSKALTRAALSMCV